MIYLSQENFEDHLSLNKSRELTVLDITKLAGRSSWPHYYAVYYALGRVPIGELSMSNLDPSTTKEMFDQYIDIIDRLHETRRAGKIEAIVDNDLTISEGPWFHVKPIDFIMFLHASNLPCLNAHQN